MARPETNQRRGRPALPKGLRKSIVMCARIDLSTYRSCRKAAATEGLRLTEWMRTRLTQAARRDLAA